ncbi:MAG: tetratricopeptide repeat protein [Alphaproteobacteria bacterium]
MHTDARGLPLTTESAEAAARFDRAISDYLEYRAGAMGALKSCQEADPGFVMAHVLQGYLMMLFGSNAMNGKVIGCIAAAEAGANHVTDRERAHIEALRAWLNGNLIKSNGIWDRILFEHPTDILALRLQHFNAFWMGRNQLLRDGIARVYPAWRPDMPGYGAVLGMYAFGLEECGDYGPAEAYGREAVERNPDDLWAIHAVAHVLEMQGRADDGLTWLRQPANAWDDRNPFKGHVWWHTAMFALAKGEYDRVLDLYDNSIVPDPSDFYLDVQNAASMLARLDFLGVDTGDRWAVLADMAEGRIGDHTLAFTEMHNMMVLAREGRVEQAENLLDSLRRFAETPDHFAASTMTPVAIPLCEAILAYSRGDYAGAIETMLPIRYDYACVGGSHAQRDIFAQYLIEAATKDRQFSLARALLAERVALYPANRDAWSRYADTLEALGDNAGATAARRKAA